MSREIRFLVPTKMHLSNQYLLSDFLGSTSIFARGLSNYPKASWFTFDHMEQGRVLCEEMLEPMLEQFGPMSITYGLISPETSRETVKYQDPDKPSYHRWDIGAAADVYIHGIDHDPYQDDWMNCPLSYALTVDAMGIPFSRIITYSESPVFCVATNMVEVREGLPRMAFYENRWEGVPGARPRNVKYTSRNKRLALLEEMEDAHGAFPWRGSGYPTYHGTKRKQHHHIRTSKYSIMTDWLYDDTCMREGIPNRPKVGGMLAITNITRKMFDPLIEKLGIDHISKIEGYLSPEASKEVQAIEGDVDWGRVWEKTEEPAMVLSQRNFGGLGTHQIMAALPDYVEVQEVEDGYRLSAHKDDLYAEVREQRKRAESEGTGSPGEDVTETVCARSPVVLRSKGNNPVRRPAQSEGGVSDSPVLRPRRRTAR